MRKLQKCWKIIIPLLLLVLAVTGCSAKKEQIRIGGKSVRLISQEEDANSLGYSLTNMNENGFVITKRQGKIYILAPTEKGLNRASSYFAKQYIGEDGRLVLTEGENYVDNGRMTKSAVCVGEMPISDYEIVYSAKKLMPVCEELQYYVQQTAGDILSIVPKRKRDATSIYLKLDKDLRDEQGQLEIADGQITISAGSKQALYEEVYLFVNTYLGWSKAGEEDAHISNVASVMRVPTEVIPKEPWIEEREAIVTLWNVNYGRGTYLDSNVSLKNNIIDYSEDQIYEYVKMLKYCGFTGVQVTEMCSTWAGVGTYEACHEKIRMMADAAHSLGMKFTLWVWGSEFADCGWVDDEALVYYGDKQYTFENPEVVKTFETYYDIYAELADCCDRVIGHYYDPGNVHSAEEIAFYAKMLKEKFMAVNPDIDFGISCWVDVYDKSVFIRELGNDITLYECGHRDDENSYYHFRTQISNFGCRMGTWAWNTCEMEIDQLAQMNFNLEIIRSVYQTARKYDEIAKPSYWSEMDSYHVLNVFSLFCAGQLLIDPDTESAVIIERISNATVGPEYADIFAEMLCLIQDARSGYTWDTYFWSNPNYILKSADYPAESIVQRCNEILPALDEMIEKKIESYTLPLPIPLEDVLRMIQPHIVQIRDYAEFRIELAKLEVDYASGEDEKVLAKRLFEISEPIKEYNTVIGTWGQIEARAQFEMVVDFCARTGLSVPMHDTFQTKRKQRLVALLEAYQKECEEPYVWMEPYHPWGLAYGTEELMRLLQELVDEGVFIRDESGGVYLADWENYRYHFDS